MRRVTHCFDIYCLQLFGLIHTVTIWQLLRVVAGGFWLALGEISHTILLQMHLQPSRCHLSLPCIQVTAATYKQSKQLERGSFVRLFAASFTLVGVRNQLPTGHKIHIFL